MALHSCMHDCCHRLRELVTERGRATLSDGPGWAVTASGGVNAGALGVRGVAHARAVSTTEGETAQHGGICLSRGCRGCRVFCGISGRRYMGSSICSAGRWSGAGAWRSSGAGRHQRLRCGSFWLLLCWSAGSDDIMHRPLPLCYGFLCTSTAVGMHSGATQALQYHSA